MLVAEKKITRVITKLDDDEITTLNNTDFLVDCFIAILDENKAKEFMNPATGEVIDRDDLMRMSGIISGLNHCKEWILE